MPDTSQIRDNYNRLAAEYARHLFLELDHKPLDRELLLRFATKVPAGDLCDMGCGPGQVARLLHEAGGHVFGLDLSPAMVTQARALNPGIEFRVGNMLSLELPDAALAGITAFYAIVNIPAEELPAVFGEMLRVLKPGGLLLLSFHLGNEVVRPAELWGTPVSMAFHFFDRAVIEALLRQAGFAIEDAIERDPYPDIEFQTRRAYLFARRPAGPAAPHHP